MTTFCFISFVLLAALWFLTNEYPTIFGVYVQTSAMKRRYFKILVAICIISAFYFSKAGDIPQFLTAHYDIGTIDCQSIMVILLASLISLVILKMTSLTGSAVYALLGGLEAYRIYQSGENDALFIVSFIAAPAIACLLSITFSYILKLISRRTDIHLIELSYYLRFVVIGGIALTSIAIGINWGGFLNAAQAIVTSTGYGSLITGIILFVCIFILSPIISKESDESSRIYYDFTTYTVLAVGFSVAITLLFFSFEGTTGIIGLKPVPLSVGALVFSAIAGCEISQKASLVEKDDFLKEASAMILAPLITMLCTYIILYISGKNGHDSLVSFTAMTAMLVTLAALAFLAYVRHHQRQKDVTDRLVYSQQQQIYENSRALNDMELKVVISENQALHNSLEQKRQEVVNVALSIVEQKEYLESLNSIVKKLSRSDSEDERNALIGELGSSLKQRISYDRDVDSQYFYAQAESLHEDFNAKLSDSFPTLTQQERRLATLLRLGFSSKYIATLMNITPKSVEISRYRLRQKLGLAKGDNLVNFIKSI